MSAGTSHDSPLDYAAFDAAPLQRGAFDYLMLAQFIRPEALSAAARDFPEITDEASYRPDQLDLRPGFKAVIDALDSDRFRHAIERKFGVDLEGCPTRYHIRRFVRGDDRIHTDNPLTQVMTVKIYFNEGPWTAEGGPLVLLRSADGMEGVLAEAEPARGSLTVFRPNERSWHCNRTYIGENKQLQLNWAPRLS